MFGAQAGSRLRQGCSAANRGNDVQDRLTRRGPARFVVDHARMIGIRKKPMNAVRRQPSHLVLRCKPACGNSLHSRDNDQRTITEGCELRGLFEAHGQLGKLIALYAIQVRRRYHCTFFVTRWDFAEGLQRTD